MVYQYPVTLNKAWEILENESNVWNSIVIRNNSFYYETKYKKIFLSSFKNKDLPSSPYTLTFLGKVLTKLSPLANIMSRRPGTEEVTFYVLNNTPQTGILGKKIDKKMLEVAAPPLVWRRKQIKRRILSKVKEYTKKNQSFYFLDIGSGAGFDSIEIERLIHRINELTDNSFRKEYASLNIDIDSKWLKNNQIITEKLFGTDHHIEINNSSIFDFFSLECEKLKCSQYDNLIISCNGFAEFLSEEALRRLYKDIYEFSENFKGNVDIILPFANKNKKQESLGKKIGFNFNAKEKQDIIGMINDIFINYKVSYDEKYSHIVLNLTRETN